MIAEERDGIAVQSLTGDIVESEAVEEDRRPTVDRKSKIKRPEKKPSVLRNRKEYNKGVSDRC